MQWIKWITVFFSNFSYKEDFNPIDAGCKCLCCQKHTRAYIYHLINTKELLSSILLMMYGSIYLTWHNHKINSVRFLADTIPISIWNFLKAFDRPYPVEKYRNWLTLWEYNLKRDVCWTKIFRNRWNWMWKRKRLRNRLLETRQNRVKIEIKTWWIDEWKCLFFFNLKMFLFSG